MAYSKQTWHDLPTQDTPVTAARLGHIEDGIEAAALTADTAVPPTRQVIAGTGLTGGGTLAADRTLTVAYGSSGTTAAVGNDTRLSDARTPTAHASTHASAGSDPVTLAESQVTNLVSDLATLTSGVAGKQPLDSDLTSIAALDASTAGAIASDGAGWIKKTYAQLKTALGLVKADVGLGNVDNTADASKTFTESQVTNLVTDLAAKQPLDSDLTTIAGLTATTDGIMQSKASAWSVRTPAQVKTDLALTKGDVGLGNVDNTADSAKILTESQITNLVSDLAAKAKTADVQVFTSSGTWTKPAGAVAVDVVVIGGGGGGGAGSRQAVTGAGGGGGGGAAMSVAMLQASVLGSTVSVTVGGGGTGGAAQTVDSTNGANGTGGATSLFGTFVRATAGALGGGGTASAGAAGSNGGGHFSGGAGGAGTTGVGGTASSATGSGGGGAGGGTLTSVASAGGAGATSTPVATGMGGTGGTVGAGQNGGAATASGANLPGGGGGGGASNVASAAAGTGSAGANYGAGGGGGGASLNGFNSGPGGNGAAGVCVVTTYF